MIKYILLTYGEDSKQVVMRLDAYKLWLKRCSSNEFDTHITSFIDDEMILLLKKVINENFTK